jgi:hypothetical protein
MKGIAGYSFETEIALGETKIERPLPERGVKLGGCRDPHSSSHMGFE